MKPIRGPINYGGYAARKRRQQREAQLRQQAHDAPTLTPQEEAERIESERVARLQSRAEMFRQATHDAHGFPNHGHVVLLPNHDEEETETASAVAPAAKTPNRGARAVGEKHARLAQKKVAHDTEFYDARRDKNRASWKRVHRLTWATSGILAMLCVGMALTRPEMNVRHVRVQGARLVPDRVLDNVKTQLVGQNIFRVRAQNATKALQNFPFVKEIRVQRLATWPPQMEISVVERAPFARVGNGKLQSGDSQNAESQNAESWLVADENGVPFRAARREDDKLDALYNAHWSPVLGKSLDQTAWKRAAQFVQLIAAKRAKGEAWNLKRVYFDEHGFASVRLAGGFHDATLIQLGGDEWLRKMERARQSLDFLQRQNRRASVLNLITYAMPVWTPRVPLPTAGAQPDEIKPRVG